MNNYIRALNKIAIIVAKNYKGKNDNIYFPYDLDFIFNNFKNDIIDLYSIKNDNLSLIEKSAATRNDYFINEIEKYGIEDNYYGSIISFLLRDLKSLIDEKLFENFFIQYDKSLPLFLNDNTLFSYLNNKKELIDLSAFEIIPSKPPIKLFLEDAWLKRSKNFYQLNCDYVSPQFYNLLISLQYDKCYIRLNPFENYFNKLKTIHKRYAIRPSTPNWLKKFAINKNCKESAIYESSNDSNDYINGLTRFDCSATRNKENYLSMMFEEFNDNIYYDKYYVTKMVHLDTNINHDNDFENAKMIHIDFAINVYNKEIYLERKKYELAKNKVDASFRTHILRFENVSFRDLVIILYNFFENETMLIEWLKSQKIWQ